jgi:hypothetical protein
MADEKLTLNLKAAKLAAGKLVAPQLERAELAKIVEKVKAPASLSGGITRPSPPAIQPPAAAPAVPKSNPFAALPFPNSGDRIRADDFRALSQSLTLIRDAFALSGLFFGRTFSQARPALEAGNYIIAGVLTVFGAELENLDDPSLDNRKVIQVLPVNLGEPQVLVVLTEAVETRRFAPNLIGLTYGEASERLRNILGDLTFPSVPKAAGQLVGLTLSEAQKVLAESF